MFLFVCVSAPISSVLTKGGLATRLNCLLTARSGLELRRDSVRNHIDGLVVLPYNCLHVDTVTFLVLANCSFCWPVKSNLRSPASRRASRWSSRMIRGL
jgi:hypothetical protein